MTESGSAERRSISATEVRDGAFWRAGASGVLLVQRCGTCRCWLHPPAPVCPHCLGADLDFEPVSGKATVWSYTVSRVAWAAGFEPPYVVAQVELDEQPGLLVMTTIVDCDLADVHIGLPVAVRFEQVGDSCVPVFAP